MMEAYRLQQMSGEHEGRGIFWGEGRHEDVARKMRSAGSYDGPMPEEDELFGRPDDHERVFGCRTMECLREWFPRGVIKTAYEHGYRVVVCEAMEPRYGYDESYGQLTFKPGPMMALTLKDALA